MIVPVIFQISPEAREIKLKTIYVDGDGGADFTSIQDAINAASYGDEIYVYRGIYYESIFINKSIQIIGENKNNTIIVSDNIGPAISILSDFVNITGFFVKNSQKEYNEGIFLSSNFSNVSGNAITNYNQFGCAYGIRLINSSNNIISKNQISNCSQSGLRIAGSSNNNTICDNTVIDNLFSSIFLVDSAKNIIYRNILYGNCIFLMRSLNNSIFKNNFFIEGIGVYISGSNDNQIYSNNFIKMKFISLFTLIMNSYNDTWNNNYWNRPRIFPKLLIGYELIDHQGRRYLKIDWSPAREPYVI